MMKQLGLQGTTHCCLLRAARQARGHTICLEAASVKD